MSGKTYRFGKFVLVSKTRQLLHASKNTENIKLSSNAYEILFFLIEKRGTVVSKDELLEKVWGNVFVEETNLAVHVSALRRVLGEKRGDNKFIETIAGRGYSFVGHVEEGGDHATRPQVGPPLSIGLPKKINSLAVLPFTNESSNSSIQYLSHGITESLIENLSQLQNLKVFARSAVFQYQNKNHNLQEIGFLLHADGLLTGHISLIGERLEVSTELVSVADQSHVWGDRYSCHFEDILQVKQEISLAVAKNLQVRLNESDTAQLNARSTSNYEAYRFYMRGRYVMTKRSENELIKAIELFHEAVKIDPNYAPAYTGIADAYLLLCIYNHERPSETIPKAKSAVERALLLDNSLSEAHASRGFIEYRYELKWEQAERSFKLAISLNPNNSTAHHRYANCLTYQGKFEQAMAHYNLALELDPFSPVINLGLINAFNFCGEYGKAIIHGEQFLEIEPIEMISCQVAMAYAKLGLYDAAFRYARRGLAGVPTNEIEAFMGWIHALAGNTDEAKCILNKLLTTGMETDPYDLATLFVGLKDHDMAFEYLEKAFTNNSLSVVGLKTDARLESLRDDARFAKLLSRANFR